ncbi:hypothetical protein vBRpoPV14_02 [Ruegeria phage vB_RpoP-V14]|uniref:Uncharacterized protein n=4 Tax=Aorunvirus V12 TaxID=2846074 RepID=A0A2Z4QF97_9CAUD|nr:hypothetical protein HYP62_gp02 [Ruegeria phage vB_RpoP-V12]AWY08789.1 hypothetical protein vBRpoPV12_2 [Ruegeria phage vB_RpoP-V12]AWY08960.1 hypothetical protein vBRpoPV21_2 [Ruegeria phage vB_RpoP-V21]AWY09521.1 hypothetical protein vBRpoPV17_2 [Ruegeria phage vB_RpoP-V17]AXF42120.1 hypothetical protein vBRpoPV14_02 [Ruegeria phage vB_RpoP-V14]
MLIFFNEYLKPITEEPHIYGFTSVRNDTTNNLVVFHMNECGLTSTVNLSEDEAVAAAKTILAHFENSNQSQPRKTQ